MQSIWPLFRVPLLSSAWPLASQPHVATRGPQAFSSKDWCNAGGNASSVGWSHLVAENQESADVGGSRWLNEVSPDSLIRKQTGGSSISQLQVLTKAGAEAEPLTLEGNLLLLEKTEQGYEYICPWSMKVENTLTRLAGNNGGVWGLYRFLSNVNPWDMQSSPRVLLSMCRVHSHTHTLAIHICGWIRQGFQRLAFWKTKHRRVDFVVWIFGAM